MGLIRAAISAVGGTMADQWKEFFICESLDVDVLAVKGQKRIGSRSANKKGSNVLTLYKLVNNQIEALEFVAKKKEKFYNQPLKNLHIRENSLIACIIRDELVIIPNGNDCIMLNDRVLVVTTHQNFDDLADAFE